ncbi:MAG: helix-turn-helix domain-containing protein [Parvularculaceae bacterium]|nr:AraC family transcriptional regulator ligand-binding domain-containing protein [Parvularculaceae bacterium]
MAKISRAASSADRTQSVSVVASTAQIMPLVRMAAASGVNVDDVMRSVGLSVARLETERRIELADYFRLQHQISAALDDETLHLSSRQLLPGTTDFVMERLRNATTLHDAMKILAQSYNLLHGGEFNSVRRRGDLMSLIIDDRRFPYASTDNPEFLRFSLECVQIFVHCMLAIVSRPHAQAGLRRLQVTRAGRSDESAHLDFWRTPIRFGAPVYSLDYDYEIATSRIDPPRIETLNAAHVYSEIVSAAASPRRAGRGGETSDFVRQMLARGVIDQTRIAAHSGTSVATLRRRLEAEGASFRDLRREVLNEAAQRLLKRNNSIADVAEELGFSDFRAFNRAFKAWNGVTPKAYASQVARKAD